MGLTHWCMLRRTPWQGDSRAGKTLSVTMLTTEVPRIDPVQLPGFWGLTQVEGAVLRVRLCLAHSSHGALHTHLGFLVPLGSHFSPLPQRPQEVLQ